MPEPIDIRVAKYRWEGRYVNTKGETRAEITVTFDYPGELTSGEFMGLLDNKLKGATVNDLK